MWLKDQTDEPDYGRVRQLENGQDDNEQTHWLQEEPVEVVLGVLIEQEKHFKGKMLYGENPV